jgi:hypothetical protein
MTLNLFLNDTKIKSYAQESFYVYTKYLTTAAKY